MRLAPNKSFGPYQIVVPLGAGGMGEVYRARERHVVLEAEHDVRARRSELARAVLAWLDKYLGSVRER